MQALKDAAVAPVRMLHEEVKGCPQRVRAGDGKTDWFKFMEKRGPTDTTNQREAAV